MNIDEKERMMSSRQAALTWRKNMKLKSHKNYRFLFYVMPGMAGILIFIMIPLLDVMRRSFMDGGASRFVGLENYKTVFSNMPFRLAVKNTLFFDVVSIPLILVLSLLLAYTVSRMKNSLIRFAFIVPMAVPSNAMMVVWRMLFDDAGVINGILASCGREPVRFLTGGYAMYLLIGTYLWKNMGYNMLIWLSALGTIPESIYEAAKLDGAGCLKVFTRMVLPNLRKAAYIITVLSLVNSFKVFREVYLLVGAYPDNNIYMLQHLFNNWFSKLDISKLAAASCVTAVFLFALLGILSWIFGIRFEKKGVTGVPAKGLFGNKRFLSSIDGQQDEPGKQDSKDER